MASSLTLSGVNAGYGAVRVIEDVSLSVSPAETVALERSLAARLGLKVDIAFDGSRGSLRIHVRSLDQLDGVIALLTRD